MNRSNKKIKLKLVPKKNTHKYRYLLDNYIYGGFNVEKLELEKYRLDYINCINNLTFLDKKLGDTEYEKMIFLNTLLGNNKDFNKNKLNILFNKSKNINKKKTKKQNIKRETYYINGKKNTIKKYKEVHIVYNKNG